MAYLTPQTTRALAGTSASTVDRRQAPSRVPPVRSRAPAETASSIQLTTRSRACLLTPADHRADDRGWIPSVPNRKLGNRLGQPGSELLGDGLGHMDPLNGHAGLPAEGVSTGHRSGAGFGPAWGVCQRVKAVRKRSRASSESPEANASSPTVPV